MIKLKNYSNIKKTTFIERSKKEKRRYYPNIKDRFGTEDIAEINTMLKTHDIPYQWQQDRLRIKHIESILIKCPETDELCVNVLTPNHRHFFQKELKNIRQRQGNMNNYKMRIYSFILNTLFPIKKKVIDMKNNVVINFKYHKSTINDIYQAKWKHSVVFKWEQGDILMLDNILTAHGRMNVIPPREILVCFGDMYNRKQCAA